MNFKIIAVGAAIVIPGGGHQIAHLKPSQPVSEPHTASHRVVEAAPVKKTDEDYIRPLDSYLENTPMKGTGKYFWQAEKAYHVKKELLMAIAYAETNYNKNPQRGSVYNAFSICSYDSTSSTCHYGSYEEAINEAARILTDARTPIGRMNYANIGQLSRASNPGGAIWAASTNNWQKNVTSEVHKITGKPVDASWNWRS